MATSTTPITLAEFERLLDETGGPKRELIEGEVFELTFPQRAHSRAQQAINRALAQYLDGNPIGEIGSEWGFRLSRDPDTLVGPDLYFLTTERAGQASWGWMEGAPDLAIEIISPSERFGDIRHKVDLYIKAGARQVWLIYPEACEAQVYGSDGSARILGAKDSLEAPELLPGFIVSIEEVCRDSRPKPE